MNEIQRINQEYLRRALDHEIVQRYSELNQDIQFTVHSRERARMALLRRSCVKQFHNLKLLDVGCGAGGELFRWLTYGLQPLNCAGVDLLPKRIAIARQVLPPSVTLQQCDASVLPFEKNCFDLVTQYTMFSSVLDKKMQHAIAQEMLRVLKPNGMIIWYDFWLNPTNKATRGIRLKEIKRLFPNCTYDATLVTLAPPIARVVAKRSFLLATLLELLPLRTHWLVGIKPKAIP